MGQPADIQYRTVSVHSYMHIIDTCIDAPSTYTPWPMPYPMSQQCNGELCGSCDRHVDAGNAGCL